MTNRDRKLFALALKFIIKLLTHILYASRYGGLSDKATEENDHETDAMWKLIEEYEKQEIL